mmetsp:Transcript_40093/g.55712  ORF Transcript_40093/g.55712 Transcript_40093/m.55712 type:complete len:302 (+) Transcript_40093:121-1026(+)|eukprot:CAMPEP_0196582796 /NCGR_PEP_ID=MMETSP1081-20130531/40706_1 /TAXON_ID=36882 /ORGANISM="Pyramimonas amylifera, Strain CCMP720" /LENGTH=301 /DNA_ID=CAMNT_0041903483 /DNA_START=113 /DNA_END=1018 /DNA_ORIENTATION=+
MSWIIHCFGGKTSEEFFEVVTEKSNFEKAKNDLTRDKLELKQKKNKLETELDEVKSQRTDLESQTKLLTEQKEELEGIKAELEKNKESLQAELHEKGWQADLSLYLKKQVADTNEKVQKAKDSLSLAVLNSKRSQNMKMSANIEDLQTRLAHLEEEMEERKRLVAALENEVLVEREQRVQVTTGLYANIIQVMERRMAKQTELVADREKVLRGDKELLMKEAEYVSSLNELKMQAQNASFAPAQLLPHDPHDPNISKVSDISLVVKEAFQPITVEEEKLKPSKATPIVEVPQKFENHVTYF